MVRLCNLPIDKATLGEFTQISPLWLPRHVGGGWDAPLNIISAYFALVLFNRCKGLFNIGNQIVSVFDPD
jgi:hypothetical protein